jgi:molybdate transport system regulatory protein
MGTRLTIRIDFESGAALGPGKVRLLELIAETGSIRKAAAGMKMSYRQAWLLLQALGEAFGEPLVATATGGRAGGGASLTALGDTVVRRYRSLERVAGRAAGADLAALEKALAGPVSPQKRPKLPRRRGQKRGSNRP